MENTDLPARLKRGKHKGKFYKDVAQTDRRYCATLLYSKTVSVKLAPFIAYLKQRHGGIINFSRKHNMKYFNEVVNSDPSYCTWAINVRSPHGLLKDFVNYIRSNKSYTHSQTLKGISEKQQELTISAQSTGAVPKASQHQRSTTGINNGTQTGNIQETSSKSQVETVTTTPVITTARYSSKSLDITALLDDSNEARQTAVGAVHGQVLRLSFDRTGCRIVQFALKAATSTEAASLTIELHGYVREAIASPHANYVIQQIITILPTKLACFIVEELSGITATVARHQYGCRIICRLLEHTSAYETATLIDEILKDCSAICRHTFGHYVILSILEHGSLAQRGRIAAVLHTESLHNARHKHASRVIEQAFRPCAPRDQCALAAELLGDPDAV